MTALAKTPGRHDRMRRNMRVFLFCLLLSAGCVPAHKALLDGATAGRLVWPPPPEIPRVEYLWSLYSFLPEGQNLADYLEESPDGAGDLSSLPYMLRPVSLCLDDRDRLYIVDQGIPRVTMVDLKTRDVRHFGTTGAGQLSMPVSIAADLSGSVYVTDPGAGKVNRYRADGEYAGELGEEGHFKRPTGIVYDRKSGRLFVIDTAQHQVEAFDSSGKALFRFGRRGDKEGEFNYPTHISAGHDGRIYITDALNFRIEVFDGDGTFLRSIGRQGDTYADLEKPKGVAVDTFGNVYVVDALQDMIKIFNADGRLLLFIGENGRAPGNFFMPQGIFIDPENRIFVADTYNMRIQALRLIVQKGP